MKGDNHSTEGLGSLHKYKPREIHSPENDDSQDEEEKTFQSQSLVTKLGWKHSLSHPFRISFLY